MNAEHPSFFELDRAKLGAAEPSTLAHLQGCERCAAHVSALEPPASLPAWALALQRPQHARRPAWLALLLLGAVASAAAVLLVPRLSTVTPAFGVKGAPAVALYLKRGEKVSLWDGHAPVQPGDELRLEVAPHGFHELLVATPDHVDQPLYAGAVDPERPSLLPTSWRVDAEPGPERLVLALSQKALSKQELADAFARNRRDAEVWTTALSFPKTPP